MKYGNKSFSVKGLSNVAWLRIFGKSQCCNAKMDEEKINDQIVWRCVNCGKKCESRKKS